MFALTTIVSESPTVFEVHYGIFHNIPPELLGKTNINRYISIRKAGWHRNNWGYCQYNVIDSESRIFIMPGIALEESPPKKHFPGYKQRFSRADIEVYGRKLIEFIEKTRIDTERDLNMLVHDLRGISSAIYNSALASLSALKRGSYHEAETEINSVIASQAMLKMRTDVIDYIGNPTSIVGETDIPIYRRTHKVCRAFNSRGNSRGVGIRITGQSYNVATGPDIFEIVPYVFIDNAIKYAPKNSELVVCVEDRLRETFVTFTSLGPKISDTERFNIFERGYRGVHALDSARPGSGLGLSLARSVVENHFSGVITVHQSDVPVQNREGTDFYSTEFRVSLPSRPDW